MSIYSEIKIQFTDELLIGQQVGFDILNKYYSTTANTQLALETVVDTRTTSFQMTVATTTTSIVGERTAINYVAALTQDLSGFLITRFENIVTIRRDETEAISSEFSINNYYTTYTNPSSVVMVLDNNVSDFSISSVTYSEFPSDRCNKIIVNVRTAGPSGASTAVDLIQPTAGTNIENPYSFIADRNAFIQIVVKNSNNITTSKRILTPKYLNPDDFEFDLNNNVLTINPTFLPIGFTFEYSIDNENWQTLNIFEGIPPTGFTAYVRDQYGCSFSKSNVYKIDKDDFVLARSPYYITYNNSNFDYCIIELYLWKGSNSTPLTPSFTNTAYKLKNSDTFLWVEVSDYIRSFLDPQLNATWFNEIPVSGLNEVCWFKYIIRSYKKSGDSATIVQTKQSDLMVASLGYGFHNEGNNPQPISNTLINPVDRYSTENSIDYLTTIRENSFNSNDIIKREPVQRINSNLVLCNNGHREFQIIYLNKYGIWDSFLFNRVSKRSVEIKSESNNFYQLRPDNYSIYSATTRNTNIDSTEEWVLNTGLLNEVQNIYLEQLISSDRWYLLNLEKGSLIPVVLDDKKFEEKLGIYEKAKIQWTIKFKSANSKINDIR